MSMGRAYQNYQNAEGLAQVFGSEIVPDILSRAYLQFDFQKNNSFELIPFLFDLDGTISMFTVKFWKQISYGSVNWGLLPFISDVRSLMNTSSDIFGNIAKAYDRLSTRYTLRQKCRYSYENVYLRRTFEGTLCLSGYITSIGALPGPETSIKILLDELGVHPDLKTVWDVVPLSFVADYFIPVGDYLESLHPRGWFNPEYSFSGSLSVSGVLTDEGLSPHYVPVASHSYRVFYRSRSHGITLQSKPTVHPEFKAPNARQLFNTAYLARARLRA